MWGNDCLWGETGSREEFAMTPDLLESHL